LYVMDVRIQIEGLAVIHNDFGYTLEA
jgi:hypothetical protein